MLDQHLTACGAKHIEHRQEGFITEHFGKNDNTLLLYYNVKRIIMFLSSSEFCVNVIPSRVCCHVVPKPAGINIYLHIMITLLNGFFFIECLP